MDQTTLVREQYDGGIKLLTRLQERGFDIAAAGWAKTAYDGQMYLYIVSPSMTGKDPRTGYRVIHETLQQFENEWSHPFERIDHLAVKLIGTSEAIAQGMLKWYSQYAGPNPSWFNESSIGSEYVEHACIYPATLFAAPQQAA
jgi:hypothetical protein